MAYDPTGDACERSDCSGEMYFSKAESDSLHNIWKCDECSNRIKQKTDGYKATTWGSRLLGVAALIIGIDIMVD